MCIHISNYNVYGLLFACFTTTQNVVIVQVPENQPKSQFNLGYYNWTSLSYSVYLLIMCLFFGGPAYLSCTLPAVLLAKSVSLPELMKYLCRVIYISMIIYASFPLTCYYHAG